MNKNKLTTLKQEGIFMGIDTLDIKSDTPTPYNNIKRNFMKKIEKRDVNLNSYTYMVKPDVANDNIMIYDNETYYKIYDYMVNSLELTNPTKTRIDYRFDCFNENFESLMKLNKLLILLIAETYNVNNRYESIDPLTLQQLCIRVQNSRIEAENYNKAVESPDGIVKNRLELRSKQLYYTEGEQVKEYTEFEKWCTRLDKSITKENFKALQDRLNTALYNCYCIESKSKGFAVNEFLYKYQNSIFTSKQMADLYRYMGYKDPEQQAKRYKQRKGIEYFSLKDLLIYSEMIKGAGYKFFT